MNKGQVPVKYFYAVMHQDEDSAFGVTFPDLPGCFSAADRIEDVLPNACEALELWFEDEPWREPTPLDRVSAEEGGTLIAVPYIVNDHRVARVNLSIERGILDAIDKAAAERSLTRSAFIAQAARNEIQGAH